MMANFQTGHKGNDIVTRITPQAAEENKNIF